MNLSLRWCVTAVVALAALSCSDPVPPAAQGAFIVTLTSGVAGRQCSSGPAYTYDVPSVHGTTPTEELSKDRYLHWTVDGESGSQVSCTVRGSSSFAFSGRISQSPRVLEITDGVLTNNMTGTARITTIDSAKLSTTLTSPAADCTITVANTHNGPPVKAGSLWATFTCPSVIHEPGDGCSAKGTFVLENCGQ